MARSLTLSRAQWQEMMAHVQRELPNEACGLLGGQGGKVYRVYSVENVEHSPWEYRMDPMEQVRVMLEIEAAGWELNGIFHSHPAGPPVPSTTDIARAYYPEVIYVIVAPKADGAWRARGFQIEEGQVEEVALEVAE